MRRFLIAGPLLCAMAFAQETPLGADFRKEGEAIQASCSSFTSIVGCAQTLFTDHPLHIAVGSIAPQNGFGFGPAFVTHWTPNESWRLSWDMDAVATPSGSWRGGAYMTAVWDRHRAVVVNSGPPKKSNLGVTEQPVFHVYAQGISLNKIAFFGEGPNTTDTARTYFGMTETIAGANVVFPVLPKLKMSLLGEANGRFVDLRPANGQPSPSTEQSVLNPQTGFAQFGEGVRIRPDLASGYIRLNYLVNFQEFIAGTSMYSFRRLTLDFGHEFPLYKKTRRLVPQDFNGPNDCSIDKAVHSCPAITRNLEGSFGLRFLMTESFTGSGNQVPFYFQPTLGGSDVNGNAALASYQDYRFRAPNNLLARASFEHSIWGPFGLTAMIDEGKVAMTHGDIDFTHLRHSYAAGLTLRAGGFPMVYLLFSWGGHEGTHTITSVNTSLLGGSARPSLY